MVLLEDLQDLAWWINETGLPCYWRIKWLNAMGRSAVRESGSPLSLRARHPDKLVGEIYMCTP